MSAYTVNKKHIDLLVTGLSWVNNGSISDVMRTFGLNSGNDNEFDFIGQLLWNENYVSVNTRYKEQIVYPEYKYAANKEFVFGADHDKKIVSMLKQIHYYNYQSCETPEWPTSTACKMMKYLEKRLIQKLSGYEAAPWGI